MANLTKIKAVNIYYGPTDAQALVDTFNCKDVLENNNVAYSNVGFFDKDQLAELFANLGTWTYGLDYEVVEFTNLPIVTWQEHYDDYTSVNNYALSVQELNNKLVPNASLVE